MRTFRAISPVVATTLLIIIAVVTAVVLYLWVSGTVSQQPTQQTKLQEAIKIDAVSIDTGAGSVTAYVRNVGEVPVTISAVYVINATSGNIICQDTAVNTDINVGETASITVTGCTFTNVNVVIVKAVTKNGVEATYLTTVG